jgi:hypothetical protein
MAHMQSINQYSLLIVGLVGAALLAALLYYRRASRRVWMVAGSVVAVIFIAWFAWRPTPSDPSASLEDIKSQIGDGYPVLLEFQSPY